MLVKNGVRTGFGKLWNVMDINNAIFKDLKSFEKRWFFKMAMEKFCIFARENSTIYPRIDIN